MTAKMRWATAIQAVRNDITNGETPCFPLDKLHDFERLFFRNGTEIDLTLEEFQQAFADYGKFNRHQWKRLFLDIDADRGGTVSWDEFTTFMIHHSVCSMGEYHRSREFVPSVVSNKLNHCHKDFAGHLVTCPKTKQLITAGDDGYVRVWDPDMSFVKATNNSRNSASTKLSTHGVQAYPICDMALGGNGSVLAVTSIDKCINVYLTEGMTLFRRYIGRNLMNDVNIPSIIEAGVPRPVDTVILMGMQDAIGSCDIATTPNGRENFVIGHMDGVVSLYPTMRHSLISDVRAAAQYRLHKGPVHRVRLTPTVGIISCSWDKRVLFSDPETGATTSSFNDPGVNGHSKYVSHFAYSHTMRLLTTIANGDKDACLWTPQMSSPAARLQGHIMPIVGLTASESEHHLMTMSSDSVVKIWDTRTFKHFQTIVYSGAMLKPTAIHYDTVNEQLVGLAGVPSSWRPRRALTAFPPSYRGHIESVVSLCYEKDNNEIITSDLCTSMAWCLNNGHRSIAWEAVREGCQIASTCLDHSGRRLFVFGRSGEMNIYNHRSGQLLREWQTRADDSVAALSICHPPNSFFVVVVCFTKVVIFQENGVDWTQETVPLPPHSKWRFTTAVAGPTHSMGIPLTLCGTTAGTVVAVCAETASVLYELSATGAFSAKVRDPLQEYVGASRIKKQVECLLGLALKGAAVVGTGEKYLHIFQLGNKQTYMGVCPVPIAPLTMVTNAMQTTVAMGDELGEVVVCDITGLFDGPVVTKNLSRAFAVTHAFHPHTCSIVRMLCIPHKSLLVIVGSNFSTVIATYAGEKVGMLGTDTWTTPPPDSPIVLPPRRARRKAGDRTPPPSVQATVISPRYDAPMSGRNTAGLLSPPLSALATAALLSPPLSALARPSTTALLTKPPKAPTVELDPSAFFLTATVGGSDQFQSVITMMTGDFAPTQATFGGGGRPWDDGSSDGEGRRSDDGDDDGLSLTAVLSRHALQSRERLHARSQRFKTDARTALTPTVGHRTRAAILKVPEAELARLRSTPTAAKGRKGAPQLTPGGGDAPPDEEARLEAQLAAIGFRGAARSVSPPSRGASPPVKYRLPSRGAMTPAPHVVPPAASTAPGAGGRPSLHVMMLQSSTRPSDHGGSGSRYGGGPGVPEWKATTTDTGRQVRAAQLANPKGWTSSISSYLPVTHVSKDVLEAPAASLRVEKLTRRRTLAPL